MPTDGVKAHGTLLSYEPLSSYGACWYYVWQAYKANGASTNMGSSATAYQGWNLSSGKHPGDRNPPPGAAIWLGRRYDGNMDGDVFIAGPTDGQHAATDQATYGQTGQTSIQARMDLCGREYLGWTDHVLDCPISFGEPPPPPGPTPEQKRMESIMAYSIIPMTDGGIYLVSLVNGNRVRINSPSDVSLLQRAKVNNSDDTMLPSEVDRVNQYIDELADKPAASSTRLEGPAWAGAAALLLLAVIGLVDLVLHVVPG